MLAWVGFGFSVMGHGAWVKYVALAAFNHYFSGLRTLDPAVLVLISERGLSDNYTCRS